MRSILEEFAYGNISPETRYFKRDSEYGQATSAISNYEEKLLQMLEGDAKVLFQKYVESQCELNQLTAVQNMIYGYKLGVLMTAEVFMTSDEFFNTGE